MLVHDANPAYTLPKAAGFGEAMAKLRAVASHPFALAQCARFLRERLPHAIAEFDVGGLVRKKVSDYPLDKLEELVLMVAQHHLKTIELFGAIIGFWIGVAQAIYFWFTYVPK